MLKKALILLGTISLIIGIIGIFLPLLPTTPFLIFTAFCYAKADEKLYKKLISHKIIGPYIENYRKNRGVPKKIKIYSLVFLWTAISVSIFVCENFKIRIMLLLIALAVTFHILKIKTLRD